ncbi:Mss4-like protein [Roridomyces roridus]|uniref:Mss4-like protein n=1 Tax=Roridomyces roridus TaxID=1738132 RepID=A0AAD7F9L0_9AGAR|nr:Mss4-like protein [Roridomyces roridus]
MKGSCRCGSLSYSLTAKPVVSVYCHCTQCQRANGAVFVAAMHYSPSAFSWTHAAEVTPIEEKIEGYVLFRCATCYTCAATQIDATKNWAVRGTRLERDGEDGNIINWEEVKPTSHIYYANRVVDVADGLPKWEGLPNKSTRLD